MTMLSLAIAFLMGHAQDATSCEKPSKETAKLIYCSCSETHHGLPVGEIRYSYYAFIADKPDSIHVEYYEDRGSSSEKKEYPATEEDRSQLAKMLEQLNVKELNGYNDVEEMCGGTTYRIYMEYSDGSKVNARWFTHSPKAKAAQAHSSIERSLRAIANRQNKK